VGREVRDETRLNEGLPAARERLRARASERERDQNEDRETHRDRGRQRGGGTGGGGGRVEGGQEGGRGETRLNGGGLPTAILARLVSEAQRHCNFFFGLKSQHGY
jgi:hypothetical protein